jgi:hypothetical protein
MHRLRLPVLLLLLTASGHSQPAVPLAAVLNSETDHPRGRPGGWFMAPPECAFADEKIVHGGRWSARIERPAGSSGNFSGISKNLPLAVQGQQITLRAFVRTDSVTNFVAVWIREDGSQPSIAFDSTQRSHINGTTDWTEHVVTVPLKPEATSLSFGVLVSGTGTAWADDLALEVDGKPFADAPKAERPRTILDTDTEFDGGSRIVVDRLSALQIDNLTTLGKVWGFLKYHHSLVTSGQRHWDYDLFRVVPAILAASDRAGANAELAKWIGTLGPIANCNPCATLATADLHLSPSLEWIEDQTALGADLSRALQAVYARRPLKGAQFYVSLVQGVQNPAFDRELAYGRITLPDAGFQLLALYRFWNIVEYWYPYRNLVGDDWDRVLHDGIVPIVGAKSADDYQRQLMTVIAKVQDTHANLWSSLAARPPLGPCQVPVSVRFVEKRPVVTAGIGDLRPGDEVQALDGVSIATLVRDWTPYYAASNEPTRLRDIARFMTRGACGEATIGVRRAGQDLVVKVSRVTPTSPLVPSHDRPGDMFQKLANGDVAYLKLSTIKAADVPRSIAAAAATKGLIVDIRNYPSDFVVFDLGQLLVSKSTQFARFTNADLANPGAFHWRRSLSNARPTTLFGQGGHPR